MFICLLPWFSPQMSTRYHEFRSVSMRLDHAVACIPYFIRKFSVVYINRPLLMASVFNADEDGCYFCACTCMCLIVLSIALCTLSKSTIQVENLINKIVINQVISYWPSYRSSASCIGPRLRLRPIQQTSDL